MQTHLTMPVLIVSVRRKFHLRISEWGTAAMAISWGLELSASPGMFGNPFFAGFAFLAPQTTWAALSLAVGFGRLSALAVNGHWRFTPHIRSGLALLSFLGWIAICFGLHHTGRATLGMVVYPWLALSDIYAVLRAASDAAIADRDARATHQS